VAAFLTRRRARVRSPYLAWRRPQKGLSQPA